MAYHIGIDIGTSSLKLILTDKAAPVRSVTRSYSVATPGDGQKEIDPDIWFNAVCDGLPELLLGIPSGDIASIGVTGQMHTVVFLDEQGKSIRPALMWNDLRTHEMIPALKERLRERGQRDIAAIFSTGSPAANLYWLKQNEPESFQKLHKFVIGPDYILFRLTGVIGTDYCEASTSSLYDIRKREWSEAAREIFGFPKSIYPTVRASCACAGSIKSELAEQFGLPRDIRIIAGTGDNPAAALSTGCLTGGFPVFSFGTSGVLMFARDAIEEGAKGKNILFSMDDERIHLLTQGVVQSCGSDHDWWIKKILGIDFADADEGIDTAAQGSDLLFYPHLNGDKTIYADPSIRGAFIGISIGCTRADMTRAVLEGLCFAVLELMENMHIKTDALRVIGGGSKSDVFMQLLADILEIKTLRLKGETGAAEGIARLAAYAVGDIDEAAFSSALTVTRIFEPQAGLYSHYRKKYAAYKSAGVMLGQI